MARAYKPVRRLLFLLNSACKSRIVSETNGNSEIHESSICYSNSLPVPTPPQIHEIELNNEDCVEEEELNMPSTSHDSDFDFEIKDDQPHKLTQS